jgi:hypothetical protein
VPIHTEPADRKYVRIRDTYDHGDQVTYGIVYAQTIREATGTITEQVYYLIEMPDGMQTIHPTYACTEITKKEYFHALLGGKV